MRWPLAVVLVLASTVWTVVPVAADARTLPAEGQGDLPTPTPLAVPWPHVGDAGSYSRSVVRTEGSGEGGIAIVEPVTIHESFLVEPSRDQYDADGTPHQVLAFRRWVPAIARDARSLLDSENGARVALTLFSQSPRGYSNYTYLGDLPEGFPDLSPPCGFRNGLQGLAGAPDTLVAFPGGPCQGAGPAGTEGAVFLRVREDSWGDGVAVGYQRAGTDRVVLAWFTSEVPYPVRMLEELSEGTYAVMDLTHFERGDSPASRGTSALQTLPPLALAAHGGIGADEAGVQHPFPWRTAWAAAQEDAAVSDFLAEHPRAVVQRSVYNFEEIHRRAGPTGEQREDLEADAWYFHLDDGNAAEKFVVRHIVGQRSVNFPVVGRVQTEAVDEVEVVALGGQAADPMAVVAPPEVPTIASALAWWQGFATPHFRAAGPNGWMTWLSGGCCDDRASVAAGRLSKSTTVDGSTSVAWEASFLHTTWDGKAAVLIENVLESDYGRASLPGKLLGKAIETPLQTILDEARERVPSLQQGSAFDVDLGPGASDEDSVGTGSRLALKPAAATTEGRVTTASLSGMTAAAAVGVAGLAWLVKALLVPLFSRVRKDSALDQQVRATLQDLVEAEPGIHLNELMRRTKRGAGTVRHHLAKLEDVGLVKSRLASGFLCYFPTRAGAAAMGAAGVTKSDGARRVLAAARAGGTAAELARRTGLAPGTVDYHLARLASAGVVRREGTHWLA